MKSLDYLNLDENKVSNVLIGLNQLLADLQVYYTNLRGFHWNVRGKGFFMMHSKFEQMYNDVAEKVDEVAERILQLDGIPSNKFSDYLKVSNVKEVGLTPCAGEAVDNILDTLKVLIAEERELLEKAGEANDEVTSALMSDYLRAQEKEVWMLSAFRSAACKD